MYYFLEVNKTSILVSRYKCLIIFIKFKSLTKAFLLFELLIYPEDIKPSLAKEIIDKLNL